MLLAVILLPGLQSCEKDKPGVEQPAVPKGHLELLKSVDLDISEPSGMCFGPDEATLLIVSDNTNKVYETTLEGEIIRELDYTGNDLEGVAYNPDDNIVAVAEERKREVVFLDYQNGQEINRYQIDVDMQNENSGLEGISYSTNNKAYYIVNEQLPGQLIIWNPQFDIIDKIDLNFASDYSGVFVNPAMAEIWFISDQSQGMYETDYNTLVKKEFQLSRTKFEGITIDLQNKWVYLVNDATFEMNIYKILD